MISPQESLKTVLRYSQGENSLHIQDHKKLDTTSLVEAGYLVPGEYADYFYCGCGGGNAEVVWMDMPNGQPPKPVVNCECGIYGIMAEELRTWTVPFLPLIHRIGEAMGFKSPFDEAVPEIVWSFGRKIRREFYFVRSLERRQEKTVRSFFMPYPTAVLIVPTDRLKTFVTDLLPDNLCFSVESIGTLDEIFRLHIDMEPISYELEPAEEEPKRQRAKRGNRAANIEKLTIEMKEHCRTSRDHYYATGKLLPRPSQGELAKRIGTRQDDVSRCLADPDATILQLLWKECENEKYILNT